MMDISHSQVAQDIFALRQNNHMREGWFVDVGCAYPIEINNTYLLESSYNWRGILIDSDPQYTSAISQQRKSSFILSDATVLDYSVVFRDNSFPKHINYLSIDLDPPDNTLSALEKIMNTDYTFQCITFEHDSYWFGDSVKNNAKEILLDYNYSLCVEDVPHTGTEHFEDWDVYNG